VTEFKNFSGQYVRRVIDEELDQVFEQIPAMLLDGPKGVGKTATALQRCRTVRRLDVEAEREVLSADPNIISKDEPPVLIDEWQRVPQVFDEVKRLVDEEAIGGRFLLTGSAPTTQTHSGAARIATLRMRPLSLYERLEPHQSVSTRDLLEGVASIEGRSDLRLADYIHEITASGFPGMRHLSGRSLQLQLDSYLERIVDHDLAEAGHAVRRPAVIRAWLRAYAAAIGTTTSWEKIRNASTSGSDSKPAWTTTVPYMELLTQLRILDPLEAWLPSNNHLLALTSSSKHYLADPALAARMVRLSSSQLLRGVESGVSIPRDGTFLGSLFESLVALSVRTFAQNCEARVFHLRTASGRHEVDFIIEGAEGILAIEAKLSGAVSDDDVKQLLWLKEKLGADCVDTIVVNTGPEAFRRADGVAVVPLGLLGP
jgi:predicted AAA+ superfamily ATPase